MKSFFPLLLLTFASLNNVFSLSEHQVSSSHASYDGNALVLEGEVQLEHGLGMMRAEKAFLQKQDAGKEFPFSAVSLHKNVLLSLKNRADLRCDFAALDFNALTGTLQGEDEELVSYTENSSTPLTINSREIALEFTQKKTSNEYGLCSLLAKGGVCIHYANDFCLTAEEASYQEDEDKSYKVLCAYPTETLQPTPCLLSYLGEEVKARSIQVDLAQDTLHINHPIGALPFALFAEGRKGSLFFQCEDLFWDHMKETLLLNKKVILREKSFGSIYAETGIRLQQAVVQGKTCIQSIHIDGACRLEQDNLSSISCFGSLHLDGLKAQMTLISPLSQGKQIRYIDEEVILQADKATLDYSEQTYQPLSLLLKGNVTLRSVDTKGPLRCALADRLTYSPDTKTLILSALSSKKVLFMDEEQKMSMSAREVHLTKDPDTGKTHIKGIGHVVFSLSPEEHAQIKARIPLEQPD